MNEDAAHGTVCAMHEGIVKKLRAGNTLDRLELVTVAYAFAHVEAVNDQLGGHTRADLYAQADKRMLAFGYVVPEVK